MGNGSISNPAGFMSSPVTSVLESFRFTQRESARVGVEVANGDDLRPNAYTELGPQVLCDLVGRLAGDVGTRQVRFQPHRELIAGIDGLGHYEILHTHPGVCRGQLSHRFGPDIRPPELDHVVAAALEVVHLPHPAAAGAAT